MLAPVNLFFDVTPIGKILQIFTEDMNVFQGEIIQPIRRCMVMFAHVLVVYSILFVIGSWEVVFGTIAIMRFMSRYVKPFMAADRQLHKIGASLWGPIHSYFHECMRGTTIIRAYGQQDTILNKQHVLLDKTTIHFIAHHSCTSWFKMRMYYSSKLISFMCQAVIAMNRTRVDTVALVLLFNWSINMKWIKDFFT